MYCNEQIRKVLVIAHKRNWKDWSIPYIQFAPELVCYVSKGYWLVLQTDNHYISIGLDGVQMHKDLVSFSKRNYWIEEMDVELSDCIIEQPETTLLKGEYLCDIVYNEDEYKLVFKSYSIKVLLYDENEMYKEIPENSPLLGFDRYIVRKCECGGKAEIFYDFVGDFYLQCNKCGKWTWHTFELKTVIDAWNDGEVND